MFVPSPSKRIAFKGEGADLFILLLVNLVLTGITLGLYHPWAKARRLSWFHAHTELDGHPFHFHGNGRELFKGFIKAMGLLVLIQGVFLLLVIQDFRPVGLLWLGTTLAALVPLVLHGTMRYRMGRTSWRGIHFGYRGRLKEMYAIWLRGLFLSLITLGVHGPWFTMALRRYVIGNIRYGSSRFRYSGEGLPYFLMNLKGFILTLATFGIHVFWWQRAIFNHHVDHVSWELQDGQRIRFTGTATAGALFRLLAGNALLVIFTLGIGLPWAEVRTMRFVVRNIAMEGDADLGAVVQTEQEQGDAMADDLGEVLDIDIFI